MAENAVVLQQQIHVLRRKIERQQDAQVICASEDHAFHRGAQQLARAFWHLGELLYVLVGEDLGPVLCLGREEGANRFRK